MLNYRVANHCYEAMDRLRNIAQAAVGQNTLGIRECKALIAEVRADLTYIKAKLERMEDKP